MRRGDLVTHAGPGDYSKKPRPALVIQSDRLMGSESVLLCLITSDDDAIPALPHILVMPTQVNGLHRTSYVMVEKIIAARRGKCGPVLGQLGSEIMEQVDATLALVVGLAD